MKHIAIRTCRLPMRSIAAAVVLVAAACSGTAKPEEPNGSESASAGSGSSTTESPGSRLPGSAPREPVTLLPIDESNGTVPQAIRLQIHDAAVERVKVTTKIYDEAEAVVAPCLSNAVDLLQPDEVGDSGVPPAHSAIVDSEGEVVVPLARDIELADGVYAEQVLIDAYLAHDETGLPRELNDYLYFEVQAGTLEPISGTEYSQRAVQLDPNGDVMGKGVPAGGATNEDPPCDP